MGSLKSEERITKTPERDDRVPSVHHRRFAVFGKAAWLLTLLAFPIKALVLRDLAAHPLLQPTGGLDGEAYLALAKRIAAGDLFGGPEAFFLPPLYAYFLAGVFALSHGSLMAARIVQIGLGAAAVGLVAETAGRVWRTPRLSWIAGGLTLLTGVFSFNETLILQSSLDPFLMALAMFLLASATIVPSPGAFLASGFGIGLLALNRPNALLMVPLLALAFLGSGRAKGALVFALAFFTTLVPVTLRNAVVAHDFVLISSHGGLNFLIGNNPNADGTYKALPGITPQIAGQTRDATRMAERAQGRSLKPSEVSNFFTDQALQFWRDETQKAIRLFVRKLALVLNRIDLSLNQSFFYYQTVESPMLKGLPVGPLVLVPLGLLGTVVAGFRLGRAGAPLLALAPAYALSVAIFFVSSRYRMPLLVPLALFSAIGLEGMIEELRRRRLYPMLLGAALIALGLGVASFNTGLDDGSHEEEAATIEFLVDNRRNDEARARMIDAQTRSRDLDALRLRIGRAFLHQGEIGPATALLSKVEGSLIKEERLAIAQYFLVAGDPFSAARFFESAMQAGQERNVALLERYAEALSLAGNGDAAVSAFREALALDPARPRARLNLAVTLANLSRFEEARKEATIVIREDPANARAAALLAALPVPR